MLSRRALMAALAASAATAPASADWLRASLDDEDMPPLRTLAGSRGLLFGAANNNFWLRDANYSAACARDCGILVPEYELKREFVETSPGVYDFSAVDALLAYAQKTRMVFRGHTLVWYTANPTFLDVMVSGASNETVFTDYINATVAHYRGHMHSWDVVNEAIEPEDGRADGLRNNLWLKRFGPSYIEQSYRAAHAADPNALLVYNEYGLEQAGPKNDARRKATLALLERLVSHSVPIGGLGLQAHINAFGRTIDQKVLSSFLNAVQAMGLKILVTEHDVDDTGGPSDIDLRDRAVADATRRLLDVVLDNAAAIAVLTWGYSDRFIEVDSTRDKLLRGKPRSLPLDEAMRPTPMHAALARAFAGARKR
jgi:endo-1,4-beta-xylanase